MRITNSMMVGQFLTDANGSLNRLSKYQRQADSTKRIDSIADDPLGTVKSLKARNKLATMEQYQDNIKSASSYLSEIESATDSLGELTKKAYESMVSAINDTKTQDQRNILAKEIENLRDEVLSVANTTMGTSYLFGGYNYTGSTNGVTKTPPFHVEQNGDLTYNGVNLSSFSRLDEFKSQTNTMTDLRQKIETLAGQVDTSLDYTVREKIVPDLMGSLKDMKAAGTAALAMAQKDNAPTAKTQDLQDLVNAVTAAYDGLTQESNKPMAEGGATGTNYFSKDTVKNIMNTFATAMGTTGANLTAAIGTAGQGFSITEPDGASYKIKDAAQTAFDAQKDAGSALQIGMTQTVDVTMNGIELLGAGRDNLYFVLDQSVAYLKGELDQSQMPKMLERLQNKQSDLLKVQTSVGTNQNRLDLISNRYEASTLAYTKMKSDAEDVDMAEAYMNLSTAKTAYNAALASGAKIVQTSLVDYLR